MSSDGSSHISEPRRSDDRRSPPAARGRPARTQAEGAVESAYAPGSPFDSEDWKQPLAPYYPRCGIPPIPQTASLLSQICEDMEPLPWAMQSATSSYDGAKPEPAAAEGEAPPPEPASPAPEAPSAEDRKEAERIKNRDRMRRLRAARDPERIQRDREKARERTRRVRASWNEERRQRERERAREYMRRRRASKSGQMSDASRC